MISMKTWAVEHNFNGTRRRYFNTHLRLLKERLIKDIEISEKLEKESLSTKYEVLQCCSLAVMRCKF